MKVHVHAIPTLLIIVILLALTTACGTNHNDALLGPCMPSEITYDSRIYSITDDLVFIYSGADSGAPTSQNVLGQCLGLTGQGEGDIDCYEAYSINGLDETDAIAVKFTLCGATKCQEFYIQYVRNE